MSEDNIDRDWMVDAILSGRIKPKSDVAAEELKTMGERIRNQEPQFHEVYENSDFKQGMNRGAFLKENQIIQLFLDSDSACAEWAIGVIQGENK
jgi:hypothetical protein